jgi:hypothetical protein
LLLGLVDFLGLLLFFGDLDLDLVGDLLLAFFFS